MKKLVTLTAMLMLALCGYAGYLIAEQPVRYYTGEITTSASGAATHYVPTQYARGMFEAIRYVADASTAFSTDMDVVVLGQTSGIPILTMTDVAGTITRYPRATTVSTNDAARSNTEGAKIPINNEQIEIRISSGGNTKEGAFHIWVIRDEVE